MPIRRYLDDKSFDPEAVGVMGSAYISLCQQLGIDPTADNLDTRRVASAVIFAGKTSSELEVILKRARNELGVGGAM